MPLTIINVSEFQQMEQSLHDQEENIFNLICYSYSIVNPMRIASEDTFLVLSTFE